ncbi:Spermatogenesis-defective protein 39 [Merluccius polli]|uniref:Spermatogenesis-defective protein 39 homolog n=1 Tax=Merluccius polli TaxID=89951 RepID=A0AA47MPU5_MERPO|nr:Spermatogenesis-defective protein 39 [Merluccius polli]
MVNVFMGFFCVLMDRRVKRHRTSVWWCRRFYLVLDGCTNGRLVICDSVAFSDTPARHYAPELRKSKCEYKDYISNWSPEETVLKMQQGKVVSLERFQSLQDKMLLLDKAVDGHDGNIITASWGLFPSVEVLFRELVARETALRHYIHYLKESGEQKVLLDLFRALGRTEDVALLQYKHHLTVTDENKRRDYLKTCLGSQCQPPVADCGCTGQLPVSTSSRLWLYWAAPSVHHQYKTVVVLGSSRCPPPVEDCGCTGQLPVSTTSRRLWLYWAAPGVHQYGQCILPFSPEDLAHVQDHYTLLERQIIIEENDKQVERSGQSDIFKKFPRKASILNMPLITTLYYSCFYHYSEPEGTYSSPANIRRTFKLAEKQYFLTALGARAKLKAWTDVDSLFTTRNWLGFTKKKSPVAFQRVLDILHKNNAPVQVLEVYVNLLEDLELKINMAHKFKCHDIIINTYRDTKDRQQLLGYQRKMDRSSVEHRKIEDVLNNSQSQLQQQD